MFKKKHAYIKEVKGDDLVVIGSYNDRNTFLISLDSGFSFQEITLSTSPECPAYKVFASMDKQVIVINSYDTVYSNQIISTDGFQTYTENTSVQNTINDVVGSIDGQHILFSCWGGGGLWYSGDYGLSFSRVLGDDTPTCAMNNDGSVQYGSYWQHSYIERTYDYWTSNYILSNNQDIKKNIQCDETGQFVICFYGGYNYGIRYSSNYGDNFTIMNTIEKSGGFISKDAGLIMFVNRENGDIYISEDYMSSFSTYNIGHGLLENLLQNYRNGYCLFRESYGVTNNRVYLYVKGSGSVNNIYTHSTDIRRIEGTDNFIYFVDINNKLYRSSIENPGSFALIYDLDEFPNDWIWLNVF